MERPDGAQAKDVLAEVERRLPPTDFEQTTYATSGARRFEKVVRFQTIPAVKAGWMTKQRGLWMITDEGRAAYARYTDPADFMRESVRLYRAWRTANPRASDDTDTDIDVEEAAASTTLEESEEAAWSEVSRYLDEMNPYEFQKLVAGLLEAMGYHIAWIAPPGPDQGIDIIASTDPLGAAGPRIKVQVKRHQNKVPVDGIRSFMAVLGANDIGLFVCTGGFTSEAQREARTQETRRITLLDAQGLFDLWIEHYDQLPEQQRQRLPLRTVYFLAPRE